MNTSAVCFTADRSLLLLPYRLFKIFQNWVFYFSLKSSLPAWQARKPSCVLTLLNCLKFSLNLIIWIIQVLFFLGALGYSFCLHSKSVCLLPKDPGPCRGSFPRYYFDKSSGQCKTFIYGGCHGNGNNFLTLKDCETTCKAEKCVNWGESLIVECSQLTLWALQRNLSIIKRKVVSLTTRSDS